MQTLKSVIAAITFAILVIVTGCSDQLTSSGNFGSSDQKSGYKTSAVEENVNSTNSVHRVQIRLKPFRSYTFDSQNTPFARINSYDVDFIVDPNVDIQVADCQNLQITSSSQKDKKYFLGCHDKGQSLNDLTIRNLSSAFVDLNVALSGEIKKKIDYPVTSE